MEVFSFFCLVLISLFCVHDCIRDAKRYMRDLAKEQVNMQKSFEQRHAAFQGEKERVEYQTIELVLKKYQIERDSADQNANLIQLMHLDQRLSECAQRLNSLRNEELSERHVL